MLSVDEISGKGYNIIMILFLYGEDNFRSHEKLMAIKMKHIDASLGDTNLSTLDFSDRGYGFTEVTRQVLAIPFLAKSRLVIIKNLLLAKKTKNIPEQIIKLLPKVPQSTILVFYEAGVPDKRLALYKKLIKEKSQEFKPLEPYQLRSWIKKAVEAQEAQIEPAAIDLLIKYCGNDLWKLKNEISKLTAYSDPSTSFRTGKPLAISDKQIELLVKPKIEAKIFDLVDAFGEKNPRKAHQELAKLLEKDEAELYIFTMIVRQFRNLLIIKDLINDQAISSKPYAISKASGLHPYVVQKTVIQARNFMLDELKNIYRQLLEFDIKLKTGGVEPKLALDLLIVQICAI